MKVFVEGIGIRGPGLHGWETGRAILAEAAPYLDSALNLPPSDLLPSAERRRTGLPVKIALAVGCEAIAQAQRKPSELPAVFASSSGDGDNLHSICETLAANGREISPTRFHNSVHNAPSGYWSIANQSMAPSCSLSCHDASFAAGLIEAGTQVLVDGNAAVLISYDTPYPQPLHAIRPINPAFGVALVLTASRTNRSLAELTIGISRERRVSTPVAIAELEAIRLSIPAARCLPLLAVLAARTEGRVCLDYVADSQLEIRVCPC